MNAWASVGDLLGPLTLAAAVLLGFGWRGAFLGGGVAMLGYAGWLGVQRFPPPHPPQKLANPFAGVWRIALDREVLLLAILLGLFGLLDEPLDGFMIAYFERVRGWSPALAAAPVVAGLVGGMAGFAAFERIAGARSPRRVILICTVAMIATLPAAIFLPDLPLQIGRGLRRWRGRRRALHDLGERGAGAAGPARPAPPARWSPRSARPGWDSRRWSGRSPTHAA